MSASVVDFDFSLFAYLFFRSNSNYLPVSVSACYWASLPGSSRSLGAATSVAIGFGMKSLMLCFVFDSLLSGVAAVGVVLDLVFRLPYVFVDEICNPSRKPVKNPSKTRQQTRQKPVKKPVKNPSRKPHGGVVAFWIHGNRPEKVSKSIWMFSMCYLWI